MACEDAKSRLRRVIGDAGVERLDRACVAVFGVGGVGSSCAEALARGGVGTLVLVDRDVVSPSNVNRQAIAFASTMGRAKVDVMAAMAREINPEVRVVTREAFVLDNVDEVLDGAPTPDFIVDAVDTVTAKIALARYAQERGIPLVASMGGANKLDPTQLRFADLFATQGCPLCRAVRKAARTAGVEALRVLYSPEQPVRVEAAAGAARAERTELGTMSYMPPIMGQMLAGYVIRELLGI
ncbi:MULTISPECIES: ThiF family adenylyltransferase [unclassified Adlercreutzia]|uniref:tRNA threonylcarbamoyladenosine dehydratase n=1 Tax=unclassified Adlercreutzia TaxID=2636013 RepID=UPI0013EE35DA|nr:MULTISPECIES: tRNA threonylcarbamoyladenosine dehydratase [unclassified Adlercreutzia]